jgi:hypothetical protein
LAQIGIVDGIFNLGKLHLDGLGQVICVFHLGIIDGNVGGCDQYIRCKKVHNEGLCSDIGKTCHAAGHGMEVVHGLECANQLLFKRTIYIIVQVPNSELFFVFSVALCDPCLHCIGQDVGCLWARFGRYNDGSCEQHHRYRQQQRW